MLCTRSMSTLLSALSAIVLLPALGCHDFTFDPHQTPGEIGIYDDLFAVSVVDEDEIFAAGYFGTVYHSADGGESWS